MKLRMTHLEAEVASKDEEVNNLANELEMNNKRSDTRSYEKN